MCKILFTVIITFFKLILTHNSQDFFVNLLMANRTNYRNASVTCYNSL